MNKRMQSWLWLSALALLTAGCGQQDNPVVPQFSNYSAEKAGTETLGISGIPLAAGAGVVAAGAGMVNQPATIAFDVPGTAVEQVLVYWSGGTNTGPAMGDDTILLNDVEVMGDLVGGPTLFFSGYEFTAYRADITSLGLVASGANTLTASGMDYLFTGANENNGVGILVVYSDGNAQADIQVRDGLDLAFFLLPSPLDATVPQTFGFAASESDRLADLVLFTGSIGPNQFNEVVVEVDGVTQRYRNQLSSSDGLMWDSLTMPVVVPAGATSLTAEVVSVPVMDMPSASLAWVAAILSLPVAAADPEQPNNPVGCTRGLGYWKNHAGGGPQPDVVSPLLPIWLGEPGGAQSLAVTDALIAVDVLKMHTYGHPSNGITKLYAFLLVAKLNIAEGASTAEVAGVVVEADAFLAAYSWQEWAGLSHDQKRLVRDWKSLVGAYNAGEIGPGQCEEWDEDAK